MSVICDPTLENLLTGLHARSDEQVAALRNYQTQRVKGVHSPTADETKVFLSDKLVALDRDKAEFCYQLCRANDARQVVEIGTSYGVSTRSISRRPCVKTFALLAATGSSLEPNTSRKRLVLPERFSNRRA